MCVKIPIFSYWALWIFVIWPKYLVSICLNGAWDFQSVRDMFCNIFQLQPYSGGSGCTSVQTDRQPVPCLGNTWLIFCPAIWFIWDIRRQLADWPSQFWAKWWCWKASSPSSHTPLATWGEEDAKQDWWAVYCSLEPYTTCTVCCVHLSFPFVRWFDEVAVYQPSYMEAIVGS